MDLAEWLLAEDNPLTARHFTNRLWKQFFGKGFSNVLDDLGNQGEWPSHPELIDWLAAEFRDSGWDVKHMIRLIVTSETYKQVSAANPALAEIDPANRLLSEQSPRRLEAEFIRDNALAASGLLAAGAIGGPSILPHQPGDYWANLNFPERKYQASTGPASTAGGFTPTGSGRSSTPCSPPSTLPPERNAPPTVSCRTPPSRRSSSPALQPKRRKRTSRFSWKNSARKTPPSIPWSSSAASS